MDNKNPAKDFINSPIPPIMLFISTAGIALFTGLAVVAITNSKDASIAWASIIGILMIVFGFLLWYNTFRNLIKINKPTLVIYRVQVDITETRRTGFTLESFALDINANKLYNVIVHLANGGGITHRSLKKYGVTQDEVTLIQEKFYEERLLDMRGSTPQHGYDLSERGKVVVKRLATYPPPGEDGGAIWQKTTLTHTPDTPKIGNF